MKIISKASFLFQTHDGNPDTPDVLVRPDIYPQEVPDYVKGTRLFKMAYADGNIIAVADDAKTGAPAPLPDDLGLKAAVQPLGVQTPKSQFGTVDAGTAVKSGIVPPAPAPAAPAVVK